MEFKTQKDLSKKDKQQIFELWNNEYPENINYQTLTEFDDYLDKLTDQSHLLMLDYNQSIKGWYFEFIRNSEKWFAIILDSSVQGKGFGTKILNMAKQKQVELNGWVINNDNYTKRNGQIYKSPLSFYLSNGFEELSNEILESPKISAVRIRWENSLWQ